MSSARVFILSGRHIGTDLRVEGPAVLGRGEDADLRLRDPSVSRAHARLTPEAEGWRLIDLGSSNGCFVGGARVETALLRDRDEFRLGNLELRLRVEAGQAGAAEAPAPAAPAPSVAPAPAATPAATPAAATPPIAEPDHAPEEVAAEPEEPADFDLELEGDWDEDAAPVVVRVPEPPAAPAPGPPSAPPGQAAPRAVGSAVRGSAPDLAGRPLLRSQAGAGGRGGLLSSDLSQQPALVRWGVMLLALALFAGVLWGSFRLVFGVRQARQAPTVDLSE